MEEKQETICILLHGWNGNGSNLWFPYLRKRIEEEKGIKVFAPDFPEAKDPTFPIWEIFFIKYIEEKIPKNVNILFVCHSMGGYFLLRFIAKYPESDVVKSIKAIVLAASPYRKCPEFRRMYDLDVDFEPIKRLHIKIVYFWSVDENFSRTHKGRCFW